MALPTATTSDQLRWTSRMTRAPTTAANTSEATGASSGRAKPRSRWPSGVRRATAGSGDSGAGAAGRSATWLTARSRGRLLVAGAGAGHVEPELAHGRLRAGELGDDAAVVDHPDAVGERQDLLQVGGDQQHRQALVAGGHQLLPDELGGADVEAPGRVGGDQQLGAAGELARQHQLLLVAAGEGVGRRGDARRLDPEGAYQVGG